MAVQNVAFYFYHGMREAISVGTSPGSSTPIDAMFDGRQGEIYVFDDTFTVEPVQTVTFERPNTPEADAIDHVLIASHNLNGGLLNCFVTGTPTVDLIEPNHTITAANGELIIVPFTETQDVLPDHENMFLQILQGTIGGSVIPELGELMFTTKREMSSESSLQPKWDHPWVRAQTSFLNESGVSSTWLKGSARKRWRFVWRNVRGADLQLLLDLQAQTADWSEPFYVQPPDDAFPTILMEVERDLDWNQDFLNVQLQVTHEVTLPLIEAKG